MWYVRERQKTMYGSGHGQVHEIELLHHCLYYVMQIVGRVCKVQLEVPHSARKTAVQC